MTMKINGGRVNTQEMYANRIEEKNRSNGDKSKVQGRSFDSIMIQNGSKEKIESNIQDMARKTALKNVYTKDISDERIAQIKEQVHNGTYQIDANLIADRLIRFR